VAIKATLYYNAVWQYILIFNSAVDRSSYAIRHIAGCITAPGQKRCMSIYMLMFICELNKQIYLVSVLVSAMRHI
jgi:hypothetical protein